MKALIVLAVLSATLLTGCFPDVEYGQRATDNVELVTSEMTYNMWGDPCVKGTIKNLTDETISAEVGAWFFDNNGVQVATASSYVNDIAPHAVARFECCTLSWLEPIRAESYEVGVGSW